MSRRWVGPTRLVLVGAAGAALVVGAARLPGTLDIGAPAAAAAAIGTAHAAAVTSSSLTCPGPETEGLASVPSAGGQSAVLAATAPLAALGGVTPAGASGSLRLTGEPRRTSLGASTTRGQVVSTPVSGATSVQAVATGALAPGLVAVQTWVRGDGDQRGLTASPCLAPRADLWLVGGGGQSTRRERIVLSNPGANTVTADVAVLGHAGAVAVSGGSDLSVPPHGRITLLLDALAGAETTPVVHVTAMGGVLAAVLQDSWIDEAVGRGADDATPSASPSTEQVIPVASLAGRAHLRIAVPGSVESVVQTRLLTPSGPVALPASGVVRVPGQHVVDVDLSALASGTYAVQVRADQPVVAGVMVEMRGGTAPQSDFSWITSTTPLTGVAGTPVPAGLGGVLSVVATGGPGVATVTVVDAKGAATSRKFSVAPDSLVSVPVTPSSQVWVTPVSGTLRSGVSLTITDTRSVSAAGPLITAYGLPSATVSATQVPVRQLG